MALETTHVSYRWEIGSSTLSRLCETYEKQGWALVRVVTVHQFEAVAVFERIGENGND